ncbi:hypothetical protein [Salibacter sp.]|uniref:hypothetical protein n=1 Tax=Salibacter sp. TaxID=2010995 RepID=UPI00286FDE40|nr:hypothetical protein [Salibacter sp.]MDR9487884.1 hypothetical protein [Salibacter sp.]
MMRDLLLSITACILALFANAQYAPDYQYGNEYQPKPSKPDWIFSVAGGISQPLAMYAKTENFSNSESGFAQTGFSVSAHADRFLKNIIFISASYRYSQNQMDSKSIASELTRERAGDYQANADKWKIHGLWIGPKFAITNGASSFNLAFKPGVAYGELPRVELLAKSNQNNDQIRSIYFSEKAVSFSYLLSGEFRYNFNSSWGLAFNVAYQSARFNFNEADYTINSNSGNYKIESPYTVVTAEIGVFYSLDLDQ